MFVVLSFSGCGEFELTSNLLCQPNLNEEYHEIYDMLTNLKYKNENIKIVSPEYKGKNSSITSICNGECAAIFYKTIKKYEDKNNNINMAIFRKDQNSKWKYILDAPLKGERLYDVFVLENKEENTEFLIVGFEKNGRKTFNIYRCGHKDFEKIYSCNYLYMTLVDINSDGAKKLFTINEVPEELYSSEYNVNIEDKAKNALNETSAINKKLGKDNSYKYKAIKSVALLSEIKKDSIRFLSGVPCDLLYCYNMKTIFDRKTFDDPCLFLNENGFYTIGCYMFLFKKNGDILFRNIPDAINRRFGSPMLYDINNDGKLEISTAMFFPGYEENKYIDSIYWPFPYINNWYSLPNPYKPEYKKNPNLYGEILGNPIYKKTYINQNNKYGLKLPNLWCKDENVTAKHIEGSQSVVFFLYNKNKDKNEDPLKEDKEKLLTIKLEYLTEKEKLLNAGYFILHEDEHIGYFADIHKNLNISKPELKISEEELKNMFFILDETQ